jgi:NADH:ubiquinone oxidoreductase subunit E
MSCQCQKENLGVDKEFEAYLDAILAQEDPKSQLIEVLHQAQERYGYLTPEAMALVSRRLRIPRSRIHGVATFYHFFNLKPRGKFVISACLGTACYVKGSPKVLEAISQELKIGLGETTADKLFTLLDTRCLGACGLAPTMMINNRIYGELTPARAVEILCRYRDGKVR